MLLIETSKVNRVHAYMARLGGPTELVAGSAAKRLYDGVTFWETGLMLARIGNGTHPSLLPSAISLLVYCLSYYIL